ncbi:MAG: radical SAM protein [Syntrophales bacterium]|nr:radical SAM protein [Syntrophales bacterium]
MQKRLLLVNPWINDFAAYDLWSAPLGLLSLASTLRENGYEVALVDCLNNLHRGIRAPKRASSGKGNFFKEEIAKPEALRDVPRKYSRYGIPPALFEADLLDMPRPDAIFVTSMMTYWYPGVFETIETLRRALPGVPVVLGGNYATLCTGHATRHSGADIVAAGEGEKALPGVLKDLFNELPSFIPSAEDLDSYPYPAFDLLPGRDQVSVMTSRGCPFRCSYCASHLLSGEFRRRSLIAVVDEIEFWNRKFGIRNFSFYDDALLVEPEARAIPMMEEILQRGMDCSFHCPNGLHLRNMDASLASLMFRAGFRTIRFGFETASALRQTDTGGKVTNEETRDAVACLLEAGYRGDDIGIYILCGLPGQSASEVRESIDFARSCGGRPVITEFSPIPGTPIWKEAVDASPYDIEEEPLYHNNTLLPCRTEEFTYGMYQELKNLARRPLI